MKELEIRTEMQKIGLGHLGPQSNCKGNISFS